MSTLEDLAARLRKSYPVEPVNFSSEKAEEKPGVQLDNIRDPIKVEEKDSARKPPKTKAQDGEHDKDVRTGYSVEPVSPIKKHLSARQRSALRKDHVPGNPVHKPGTPEQKPIHVVPGIKKDDPLIQELASEHQGKCRECMAKGATCPSCEADMGSIDVVKSDSGGYDHRCTGCAYRWGPTVSKTFGEATEAERLEALNHRLEKGVGGAIAGGALGALTGNPLAMVGGAYAGHRLQETGRPGGIGHAFATGAKGNLRQRAFDAGDKLTSKKPDSQPKPESKEGGAPGQPPKASPSGSPAPQSGHSSPQSQSPQSSRPVGQDGQSKPPSSWYEVKKPYDQRKPAHGDSNAAAHTHAMQQMQHVRLLHDRAQALNAAGTPVHLAGSSKPGGEPPKKMGLSDKDFEPVDRRAESRPASDKKSNILAATAQASKPDVPGEAGEAKATPAPKAKPSETKPAPVAYVNSKKKKETKSPIVYEEPQAQESEKEIASAKKGVSSIKEQGEKKSKAKAEKKPESEAPKAGPVIPGDKPLIESTGDAEKDKVKQSIKERAIAPKPEATGKDQEPKRPSAMMPAAEEKPKTLEAIKERIKAQTAQEADKAKPASSKLSIEAKKPSDIQPLASKERLEEKAKQSKEFDAKRMSSLMDEFQEAAGAVKKSLEARLRGK